MTSPVLDRGVLRRLGEDIGDPAAMHEFLGRYASLLDARIDRVTTALSCDDRQTLRDAALSLSTSSAMAGATALAEYASTLLDDVIPTTSRSIGEAPVSVPECLRALAARTRCQVHKFLLGEAD